MPRAEITRLFLILLFCLIPSQHLTAMPTSEITTEDPNDAAHKLLEQFGLPRGLLPGNVVSYNMFDDGRFSVELSGACYSQFTVLAYYEKTIQGKITKGTLSELSGIEVRKFFVWFPISRVEAGDGTILFDTGHVSEKHPVTEFQDVHPCKSALADELPVY